jgi:alkanesulfonate monooxygenase SsuD/methylene tetrahydromethanopterin reductase-like flavin-dependent oxidoreductase (luciferase family)
MSGFGAKSIALAARLADGYVTVGPERDAIEAYRADGGSGPISGSLKVCWGEDRDACVRTVHRMWPNEALAGELAQVLPSPRHFEQAAQLVTEQQISDAWHAVPGMGFRLIFELTERFEFKDTTSGTRARMTFVIG